MNELLSKVADYYLPFLLLVTLGVGSLEIMRGYRWFWVKLFASAILVFGVMLLDHYLRLWSTLGLDYSTHSAIALALVVFVGAGLQSRIGWVFLFTSLLAYLELMFYLEYHSWGDMGSTLAVIGLGLGLIYRFLPDRTPAPT
jgi:hypothetical protein